MNFLAPEMLLGLLRVPSALGFYLWAQRRRSRYAVRFTNLALLSNLVPRRPSWRRHLPPALYLGAIAALLIGLAGGWVTAVTGGIAAAFIGHAVTRFAVFLSTGHAGQFLPRGREVEEIEEKRRPPKGWRVIGPRESTSRDR